MVIKDQFSVWPLLVDMLTSILIIFVLFSFFDDLLNRESIEQVLANVRREAFVKKFDEEFTQEINKKNIRRVPDLNYLKITFSDGILFKIGAYNLDSDGKELLDRLAPIIKGDIKENVFRIQVEGHTDESPVTDKRNYPKDNWELSTARAISVIRHLSYAQKVKADLFSANGYGPYVPVSRDNSKNRRIEIKIYFSEK